LLLAFESRELRTLCEQPPALWPSELDRDLLIDRLVASHVFLRWTGVLTSLCRDPEVGCDLGVLGVPEV
jgi:hypothetical protein